LNGVRGFLLGIEKGVSFEFQSEVLDVVYVSRDFISFIYIGLVPISLSPFRVDSHELTLKIGHKEWAARAATSSRDVAAHVYLSKI
jgi:hypothetical protein